MVAPINPLLLRAWFTDLVSVFPTEVFFRGVAIVCNVSEAYKSREMQVAGVTVECQYEVRISDMNVAGLGLPLSGETLDFDGARYRIVSVRPSGGVAFLTLLVAYIGATPVPISEPNSEPNS